MQLCGDINVASKWINGEFAQGTRYKEILGKIQRILHHKWKRGTATPISNVDNIVQHVCREHNQEADHWDDIGAQGRRKIDIYRKNDTTTWEAIRGFCDGSFKDDGKSGCGIVTKGSRQTKNV